jgi:uncharacterized membrane protein
MRLLPLLLALAFPVLAHAAAASGSQRLAALAVACLMAVVCWSLRARPWAFVLAALGCGAILAALLAAGHAELLLLLPPVLITFAVGLVFARTLAPGRTPLVERVVRALDPEALDDPQVPGYARQVTGLWAGFLFSLALLNAVLALVAVPGGLLHALGVIPPVQVSQTQWSLFANVLNYLLIGAGFVAEYGYRRWRFPQREHRAFGEFLRRIARLGPAFWRES